MAASAEQQATLRELAGSAMCDEAGRARAVLLMFTSWTAG